MITLRTHKNYKMLLLPLENMLWKAKTTILFPFAIFGLVSGREVLHLSRIVLTLLGMFAICYKIMKASNVTYRVRKYVLLMI